MRKILLLSASALSISGCGMSDVAISSFVGYSTICVDEVLYIQFTHGASVAYNTDGSIKTCGRKA